MINAGNAGGVVDGFVSIWDYSSNAFAISIFFSSDGFNR